MSEEYFASARSLLFVPGDRPDRFAKAAASGADGVVLDLEDAVAAPGKEAARQHVDSWLASGGVGVVRINGFGTPWFEPDVAMVSAHRCVVMLPKANRPRDVVDVRSSLHVDTPLIPLIETASGVLDAAAICAAPGVVRAAFGSVDLSTQLGIDPADRQALAFARSAVVLASAAAGVAPPLDGVTTDLDNADVLGHDAEHAAALGFTGKLCIHPAQISVVNRTFTPAQRDVDWARKVVDATGSGGVAVVDGQMIDKPVVERAERILDRARSRQ
ncbi:CoA ester lyase [Mycobacterium sp.]|uniref:HpcH/HpaI aldolase/citrate lyase family protein n=1 Tax=Mycobacterium sp. TaxID=1785 RepID=UPI0025F9246F|nr:CoA ester lyase [Mycobacterium sp.]